MCKRGMTLATTTGLGICTDRQYHSGRLSQWAVAPPLSHSMPTAQGFFGERAKLVRLPQSTRNAEHFRISTRNLRWNSKPFSLRIFLSLVETPSSFSMSPSTSKLSSSQKVVGSPRDSVGCSSERVLSPLGGVCLKTRPSLVRSTDVLAKINWPTEEKWVWQEYKTKQMKPAVYLSAIYKTEHYRSLVL